MKNKTVRLVQVFLRGNQTPMSFWIVAQLTVSGDRSNVGFTCLTGTLLTFHKPDGSHCIIPADTVERVNIGPETIFTGQVSWDKGE